MMSEREVRITLIIVDLLAALSAFIGAVGLVALAITASGGVAR